MLKPLTMDKFDGGIVDNYLNTDPNRYSSAVNLQVDETGNLYSRPGTSVLGRVPLELSFRQVSGCYYFPQPFDQGLFVLGRRAYTNQSAFTEVPGYSGNGALAGQANGALEQGEFWHQQFIVCPNGNGTTTTNRLNRPQRIYCKTFHSSYQAVTLGLPRPVNTVTSSSTAGTGSFNYALHYQYSFTDYQGTTYVEHGPVIFYSPPLSTAPNVNPITLNTLPVLANTSDRTNYDTVNITLQIFRTTDAGTTYYTVGQVTNGTTSFVDSASDASIQILAAIYTDGGILEWTQPPTDSLYVTQVNDFFFYAGSNFITQSIQGAPGACPGSFQDFVDQPVRGLSSIIGYPILFCDKSVYRVVGTYDEFGNGGFSLVEIDPAAGCISSRSIVKVPGGLAWAGNGAFYFTDGSVVHRLCDFNRTNYGIWSNSNMVGAYNSVDNIVYWTISTDPSRINATASTPIQTGLVAWHMIFGVRPDAVFTTWDFGNNIFPTALFFAESVDVTGSYRNTLVIGDARGYVLNTSALRYTDPYIDTNLVYTAFRDKAIIYDFISAGLTETPAARNYSTNIVLECGTDTDIAVSIRHRADDKGKWDASPEVRQDGAILWNISDLTWGTPAMDIPWDSSRVLQGRRTVPGGQLRSQRRQVRFTNALTHIYRSDDFSTATVLASRPNPTVTLDNVLLLWPSSPEDYFIAFETAPGSGVYGTSYQIKSRDSDLQISLFDPYQALTNGATLKWQITGYRKYERFELLSYTLFYEVEGDTQDPSPSVTPGVNT